MTMNDHDRLVIRAIQAWGQHPPMDEEETRDYIEGRLRQKLPDHVWVDIAWEIGFWPALACR